VEALRSVRFAALVAVLLSTTVAAQEPVWPLANGSHELLHSFQNPFSFSWYFHEGVDLRGSLIDVVAVRSGTVRYKNQSDSGGNLLIEVQTPGGTEADSYLHVILDPWQVGDPIDAGDRVGVVNDNYFSTLLHDHVHVNRFASWAGGNGYVTGRTNMLHPLKLFADAADRDPQTLQAAPQDANEDGFVFHVSPNNTPTTQLPYAFKAVELLLEATDRLSSTLYWNQGLVGVGYWVDCLAAGDDVASAAQPYRLLRFNDAWRGSHSDCDTLVPTVMVTSTSYQVEYGPHNTLWYSLATYRLTKTSGFQGLGSAVSSAQSWVTDARTGSGSANGTGAALAREIQEARFVDGRYRVHALTEDLVGELDTTFDVVVDNFRPYVKSFRLLDAGSNELYRARWTFDPGTSRLSLERGFSGSGDYVLAPGDQVVLEIEFSEPMASATLLAITPATGSFPALSSIQGSDERTLWSTTLTIAQLGSGRFPRLHIAGEDLAGTTLYPFASGAPLTAPFNKRANSTPIVDPTEDALHVIPIARRHAPTTPP